MGIPHGSEYPVGAPSFGAIDFESGARSIAVKETAPTWFIAVEETAPTEHIALIVAAPAGASRTVRNTL
jgi:hypothetical protein